MVTVADVFGPHECPTCLGTKVVTVALPNGEVRVRCGDCQPPVSGPCTEHVHVVSDDLFDRIAEADDE